MTIHGGLCTRNEEDKVLYKSMQGESSRSISWVEVQRSTLNNDDNRAPCVFEQNGLGILAVKEMRV